MISILRVACIAIWAALPAKAADVTVFAAASLGEALAELASEWASDTGGQVTQVLAGSAALARQIEAGAPADVYISAHEIWMDWLDSRDLVLPGTRVAIASNRLVLVAHAPDAKSDDIITPQTDFIGPLGDSGRLAIALPEAVPAGIYAEAALRTVGAWPALRGRLAQTDNVRAALALVALGEAPFGIVYASDAMAEPGVVIAGHFPTHTHPTIRYPAAVVAGAHAPDAAADFVAWLSGHVAQAILASHGFVPIEAPE